MKKFDKLYKIKKIHKSFVKWLKPEKINMEQLYESKPFGRGNIKN